MKKPVYTSNLAIRFYKSDGWTADILNSYVKSGKLLDSSDFGDQELIAYYTLKNGELDIERLYEEQISRVGRGFNDHPYDSDLNYLKRYL